MTLPAGAQASAQWARRRSSPSQNLTTPEEAPSSSIVRVAQCCKYSRAMDHCKLPLPPRTESRCLGRDGGR